MPANVCNTDFLPNECKGIVDRRSKIKIKNGDISFSFLTEQDMLDKKMGCIEAVSRGSAMPGYVACVDYKSPGWKALGDEEKKLSNTLVLVGKGLVFDTGGVNLKGAPRGMR